MSYSHEEIIAAARVVGALSHDERLAFVTESPGFLVGVSHRDKDMCQAHAATCLGEHSIKVVGVRIDEVWLDEPRYWHARWLLRPPTRLPITDLWIPERLLTRTGGGFQVAMHEPTVRLPTLGHHPICVAEGCYMFAPGGGERIECEQACYLLQPRIRPRIDVLALVGLMASLVTDDSSNKT